MNSLAYFFYHAGLIHEKFIIGQHFKIFVCELVFKQTAILTIIPFPINIKNAFGDIIPHVETRGNISFPRVVGNIHIHWADPFALTAGNAFGIVTPDPKK